MVLPPKCDRSPTGWARLNLERAERKFDVMQALGTDLVLVCSNIHAATIDDDGVPRWIWLRWRNVRGAAGCGWATRHWRGGRQPMAARLEHRAFRRPWLTRPHPGQFFMRSRWETTIAASPAGQSSSSSSPTHRVWRWTRCPGAATSGTFPGRAGCRLRTSCAP